MTTPAAVEGVTCPTCYTARPSARYCAPTRCYCGHPACPSYASYVDMTKVPLPSILDQPTPRRNRR